MYCIVSSEGDNTSLGETKTLEEAKEIIEEWYAEYNKILKEIKESLTLEIENLSDEEILDRTFDYKEHVEDFSRQQLEKFRKDLFLAGLKVSIKELGEEFGVDSRGEVKRGCFSICNIQTDEIVESYI